MTSFATFPIDRIWLDRSKRQRRELEDIPELASSISRVGRLINPILIKRDGELIAGERRLEACKSLGWTSVTVHFAEDDMPEDETHLLELEENVARVDLSWQDRAAAIERYHQLRLARDPEWNNRLTGEALGLSSARIDSYRAVQRAIDSGDTALLQAETFRTALNILERRMERAREGAADEVFSFSVATPPRDLGEIVGELPGGEAPTPAPAAPAKVPPILNADFNVWAPAYAGPKFNFLHCDFPYGIDAQAQQQGNNTLTFGSYEDGEDVYWQLLQTLHDCLDRLTSESCHLMFWFSMKHYIKTVEILSRDWIVNPFPLVWVKSDNMGLLPDPRRGPRRIYETALLCYKGDRPIAHPVSNAFASPTTKEIHMSEKPLAVLQHFFKMFVDSSTIMLDPTAGSCTALKAAERMGARSVLGLEREKEFFRRAREAYYDVL